MNKNEHLISRYLAGELTISESARFEEDLKKSPQLQEDLKLYREVEEALADTEVMNLRMQLNNLHTHFTPEPYMPSKPKYKKFAGVAVAATLAVLLGFSAVNLYLYNDSQRVLDKYYQPYEITSTTRAGSTAADRALRSAMEKYQMHNYQEAVVLFEKVLEKDPSQMGTHLYAGISNFEIAEYTKAGKSFTKVIEHNDNLYIEQAKWYLGFCYLKTEEKDKAIKQFREIANSKSYYSDKAKSILKKL